MAYEAFIIPEDLEETEVQSFYFRPTHAWRQIRPDRDRQEAEIITIACTKDDAIKIYLSSLAVEVSDVGIPRETENALKYRFAPSDKDLRVESEVQEPAFGLKIDDAHNPKQMIFRHVSIPAIELAVSGDDKISWTAVLN